MRSSTARVVPVRVRARIAASIVVLFIFTIAARASIAKDDPPAASPPIMEKVSAHEDQIDDHAKADQVPALQKDMELAVALYKEAAGHPDVKAAREHLVKAVGLLLKRERDADVRKAGLKALGDMGHPDGARYVKSFIEPVKKQDDEVDPWLSTAIDAAGAIGDDSLVLPLLKVVEDSENFRIAALAAQALGKFRHASWRLRKKIVEDLVGTLVKDKPGRARPGKDDPNTGQYIPPASGSSGTDRWGQLSGVIPTALNELTGQHLTRWDDWNLMVRDHKHDLKVLFIDQDDER